MVIITKQELETIRNKAPLMSEGLLSPYQVSNMSKREKAEWEKNKQIRFNAEQEFKEQNKTPQEREQETKQEKLKAITDRIIQIESQIRVLKNMPQILSKRNNKLKETYNNYLTELKGLKGGLKEWKFHKF